MINFIFLFSICLLLLFLLYSVIPTVFIRLGRVMVMKEVKGAEGIALTFDDGPNPRYTNQLLDLLKMYEIKASFFVVGSKAVRHPEIIKRMSQEGHAIGIHHYEHISSWILSPFHLWKHIRMTEKVLKDYTNQNIIFYRPPWGHFNIFSLLLTRRFKVIMWSHIFGDWNSEKSKNTLLDQLRKVNKPGSILLLHDCGETLGADEDAPKFMIENLGIFLEESKKQGRVFINLKDL